MKPTDILPGDRQRYFHNGLMLCDGEPVWVSVNSRGRFVASKREGPGEAVALRSLEPYYPEAKCINTYGQGLYIGRRARQLARRTASLQHYEVQWYPPQQKYSIDQTILWDLCGDQNYPIWQEALDRLTADDTTYSVAVSPDLILTHNGTLVYRDQVVGVIDGGIFIPEIEGSCFTKLARMALQEINAPCL